MNARTNNNLPASMRTRPKYFLQEESGQTLVIAAVCMVVLIGFLGLAIDVGQARYQKRRMQMAADAAALAGALELPYCQGAVNCPVLKSAAQNALVENGFKRSTLLTNCAAGTGAVLEMTLNTPPCGLRTGDPNAGKAGYVEVILSQPQPTIFARVLGIDSIPLLARGEAGRTGGGNCIYALDPVGRRAIRVLFAVVRSTCGIVDESVNTDALECDVGAIQAPQITVAGGVPHPFFCDINPAPVTNAPAPVPADPLASLPKPSVPACGTSKQSPFHGSGGAVSISGPAILYPDGAYCGGITLKRGAMVTFAPGVYALTSTTRGKPGGAGGLTVDLGTTVNGTGVTFYNYGPAGAIRFMFPSNTSGGVKLVAPVSGPYAGILFFQDPRDTAQATIIGSLDWNTVLEGTYYFPKATVAFAFDGAVKYNILVAYNIEFLFTLARSGQSSFASDYSSLVNGSPVGHTGAGAAVVQ